MNVKFKHTRLLDDDEECPFEGSIIVDIPPHDERANFARENGLADLTEVARNRNTTDEGERVDLAVKMSDFQAKFSKKVKEKVTSCDLVAYLGTEDEIRLTTAEELWCHPEATALVEGLIVKFMTNFAGEKKKPSSKSS